MGDAGTGYRLRLLDAYRVMAQEPWCFTPQQIGKLTDWQIVELYRRKPGSGVGGAKKKERNRLPSRETFVTVGVQTFLKSREELERQYDAAAAEYAEYKAARKAAGGVSP